MGAVNEALTAGECDFEMPPSFEEFEACTAREVGTGAYLVDGDIAIHSRVELSAFYERLFAEPPAGSGAPNLVVDRRNGVDSRWSDSAQNLITYCVSDAFGARQGAVIAAMQAAEAAWENAAAVNFVHFSQEDATCDANNGRVTFDVRPVVGQSYLARAFFPYQPRDQRNVLIDESSFRVTPPLTLAGILRHELGHTLGFRHEHTRPESGQCFEDSSWRPLTPYDRDSVMHYPQCGGTAGWALQLSSQDRAGAAALYGAPLLVAFRTRANHFLNSYDARGAVSVVPRVSRNPQVSDELFWISDLNGGRLMSGDTVMIRTRTGHYVNCFDSLGAVSTKPIAHPTWGVSDEIFVLARAAGDGPIQQFDKLFIKTRAGYFFNAWDSRGSVSAVRAAHPTWGVSDELFEIQLGADQL